MKKNKCLILIHADGLWPAGNLFCFWVLTGGTLVDYVGGRRNETRGQNKMLNEPTRLEPGTTEKVELMRARHAAGLPLHVDGDRQAPPPASCELLRVVPLSYFYQGVRE